MSTTWTGDNLDRWFSGPTGTRRTATRTARATREPVMILLARPARERAPSAVVWQLVIYDPNTRTPIADIATRWEPAGPIHDPSTGPVPGPILRWICSLLGAGATVAGPAHDLAGPDSWHITATFTASADTAPTDTAPIDTAADIGTGTAAGTRATAGPAGPLLPTDAQVPR